MARIVEDASFERARNHIATLALSMYQIHGLPAPSSDELGSVVARAEASMSLHQLRHPESISASAIGQIDQLVMSAADIKKRPTNIYSADAARGGQGGGDGQGKSGLKGTDALDRLRSSPTNVRYREAYGDGGTYAGRSDGGARYDMVGSPEWRTERGLAITRSYALSNDMAWATKQPDLMKMGQPALQALHEVKLKGDGYDDLHSKAHLNFDNKTIVDGAAYMKRNGLDYNHAAKSAAKVYDNTALNKDERSEWRRAIGGVYRSKDPAADEAAKAKLRESGSHIKQHHPEMAPDVDRALKANGASSEARLNAEASAGQADATAKLKDASNNEASAKMAELLKRRKAAQAGPQPSH